LRIAINWPEFVRALTMLTIVSAFLAFLNPYGAVHSDSLVANFMYWFTLILLGGVFSELAMWCYRRLVQTQHIAALIIIASIGATIGVVGSIYLLETVFYNGIPLEFLPRLAFMVFVISLGITLISFLVRKAFADNDPAANASKSSTDATFMQRLPVKYRTSTLYAISSEDHYLRVYTSLGEELILMRLADAILELGGDKGLQVHRSWWIAHDAVSDERKDSGRSFLITPSGTEVPVSRSYRSAAKDAGLIR